MPFYLLPNLIGLMIENRIVRWLVIGILLVCGGFWGYGSWTRSQECTALVHAIESRTEAIQVPVSALNQLDWRSYNGVMRSEVHVAGRREGDMLWLYRPARMTVPKVPCVVIAPAGTRLFHGVLLSDGDEAEHIPYVEAGFAVVAYEIDGPLSDVDLNDPIRVGDAASKYVAADAGIRNARLALSVAEQLPWVDPKRIFVVGHSSAATLALQVAAFEQKHIAGCVAYAPEVDVANSLGGALGPIEHNGAPGIETVVQALSPNNLTARFTRPMFLFVSRDDTNVHASRIDTFTDSLRKSNYDVTYETVESGGHYQPMIDSGIPKAIEWMRTRQIP